MKLRNCFLEIMLNYNVLKENSHIFCLNCKMFKDNLPCNWKLMLHRLKFNRAIDWNCLVAHLKLDKVEPYWAESCILKIFYSLSLIIKVDLQKLNPFCSCSRTRLPEDVGNCNHYAYLEDLFDIISNTEGNVTLIRYPLSSIERKHVFVN